MILSSKESSKKAIHKKKLFKNLKTIHQIRGGKEELFIEKGETLIPSHYSALL